DVCSSDLRLKYSPSLLAAPIGRDGRAAPPIFANRLPAAFMPASSCATSGSESECFKAHHDLSAQNVTHSALQIESCGHRTVVSRQIPRGFFRRSCEEGKKGSKTQPETAARSEERRVGKECRYRWGAYE